jgi:hypothetical protein
MKVVLAFNLSRVYEHYRRKRFCIVSGYLFDSKPEVNLARAAALKQVVRAKEYGVVEMEGHWVQTRGPNKGLEVVEKSLFIPECSYNDATYFGSGKYYAAEPLPQEAIVFAEQDKLLLLGSTPGGKWEPVQEFDRLLANMGPLLEQWYQRRSELSKLQQEEQALGLSEEEIKARDQQLPEEKDYMGWSVLNPKRKPQVWKFSSVTVDMIEPPDKHAGAGSQGGAMKQFYWDDRKGYEFYQSPQPAEKLVYRGALYQKKKDS